MDKLKEYLNYIDNKIIYAEDNIYRLMLYRNEKTTWLAENAMLYETGTGISTSGDSIWAARISADWIAANNIMTEWIGDEDPFDRKLLRVFSIYLKKKTGNTGKFKFLITHPVYILRLYISKHICRSSPMEEKSDFIRNLYC